MGFRVRRSFKLAPGVKINVSKSGLSTSLGGRGASINIGRRGIGTTLGIPGTGISSRQIHSSKAVHSGSYSYLRTSVSIKDDGELVFLSAQGNPLSEAQVAATKRQNGPAIRQLIEQKCAEINSYVEALGLIHQHTPAPDVNPVFSHIDYPEPEPSPPKQKRIGLLGKTFKAVRTRIEARNSQKLHQYEDDYKAWQAGLLKHEEFERDRRDLLERRIYSDPNSMQSFLEEVLQGIEWPRETSVSMEILEGGRSLSLDVDLPELEDFPRKTASVPQRGYKLTIKDISESNLRKLYANHVHGIGFRLIGESFSSLPNLKEVVVSAFSQRPNPATGRHDDQYLYSVKVSRNDWEKIDFSNLQAVDVSEALSNFEMRRSMTKTGIFKPIEPFKPLDGSE